MNASNLACENENWHLSLRNPGDPFAPEKRVPYRCRSWRHEGDCRQWKGAQDFVRVAEAMSHEEEWTFLVLTFRQREWPDKSALYRAGVSLWSKLRKRFVYRWGPMKYVQTWERHAKGGPHVNVVCWNRRLWLATKRNWRKVRSEWLIPSATASGFGEVCWIEPIRNARAMAGYLNKCARELTGAGPKGQIPIDAPAHFRRIRASHHTLPPVERSGLTGTLHFGSLSRWLELTPLGKMLNPVKERKTHDSSTRPLERNRELACR